MLLTGLAPTLVSCLILFLVSFFLIRNGSLAMDRSHEENLSYVVENNIAVFSENADNLCRNIADAEWFHDTFIDYCLSEKPLTALEKEAITTDLSVFSARFPYVEKISFRYFWNPDTLFTNFSVYENISFYEDQYPGRVEYTFFDSAPDGLSHVTVGGGSYLLYSKNISDGTNHSAKGRVNILLSERKILDILNRAVNYDAKGYAIKNSDGTVVWQAESGIFPDETGEEIPAENSILTVPLSVARRTVRKTIPVILVLFLIDIFFCVLLTLYYSRAAYAPLAKTVERFHSKAESSNQNEYEILNSIMTEAFKDKKEAQASLDLVYPLARQRLLRAILDGTAFLDNTYESIFSRCGIDFRWPLFNIIAIYTSLPDLFSEDADRNMEFQLTTVAVEDAIKNASDGLLLSCSLYLHSANRYSAILNYKTSADLKVFIQRLYHTLKASAPTLLCEGNEVERPEDLHIASDQADFTINCSMPSVTDGILRYQDVIREAKMLFYYSHSEGVILAKAITEGNLPAAEKILDVVLKNNEELTSFYSVSCLYHALASTILSSAQETGVTVPYRGDLDSPKDICEVKEQARLLLTDVIRKVREKYVMNITSDDENMIKYIEEHLYDKELSLAGIADAFGRSQASVSESFKRITGRKYIDYVNEKRIRRALELIYTENLDMQKVYPMVGYSSISTFRRNYQRFAEGRSEKT